MYKRQLLGRTRHTRIIENILEGSERDKPVTADEFEEIAPILTSEQADVIIKEDILEGIEEEDGIDAVSYTHLDVYKRQE